MYFPFPCLITGGQLDSFCCILGSLGLCCRLQIIGSISCWSFTLPVGICSESQKKNFWGCPNFDISKLHLFLTHLQFKVEHDEIVPRENVAVVAKVSCTQNYPKWLSDFTYFTSQAAKQPLNSAAAILSWQWASFLGGLPHFFDVFVRSSWVYNPTNIMVGLSCLLSVVGSFKKNLEMTPGIASHGVPEGLCLGSPVRVGSPASCGWDGKQWSPRGS